MGSPDTEGGRKFLIDRSPNHVERATRPMLIAHGLNDVRVVAAESQQIESMAPFDQERSLHSDRRFDAVARERQFAHAHTRGVGKSIGDCCRRWSLRRFTGPEIGLARPVD
jgi:hypothetical protein